MKSSRIAFRHAISLITLLYIMPLSWCLAQSNYSVYGKVIDAKTKEPIPFANVFLANTLIGSGASVDGSYSLKNITLGTYDLTVSSVGYRLTTIPITIQSGENKMDIELLPEARLLKEVVVRSSRSDYLRQLRLFKKYFLGETRNSQKCEIMNITDIEFEDDKKNETLKAFCDQPLIIENRALGYRVFYFLQEFKLNSKSGYLTIAGVPRFEPLVPKNNAQLSWWTSERERAYNGSINHFMRSLKHDVLFDNKFSIYLLSKFVDSRNITGLGQEKMYDTLYTVYPVKDQGDLFRKGPIEKSFFKIVYRGESQEIGYESGEAVLHQTSYLKFKKHALVIYDNGYYEDPLNYYIDGYWGWTSKAAELLPLEYQPGRKDIIKPTSTFLK